MIAKKPVTTYKRSVNNVERKLCALFKIIFGTIFAYEKMFVLETLESKVYPEMISKAGVQVRPVQHDDILKLSRFKNLRRGIVQERFKAGHLCFIAEKSEDIANYTWVCFKECWVSELERNIQMESGCAYRYDGYTVSKYRGMGILPVALTSIADYLFRNGIRAIYDCVASNNFSSIRSHSKIGSRKIGEVTLIRLIKLKRYRCKGETTADLMRLRRMFSI
jgi:hypothetical protein